MRKKMPILDLYLSAFLSLHGLQPELTIQGTRIIFEFPSSKEVFQLSREFNTNPAVSVLDYVRAIRQLKAKMFSMKGEK
jgi:P pilus assembly chaperone PapD